MVKIREKQLFGTETKMVLSTRISVNRQLYIIQPHRLLGTSASFWFYASEIFFKVCVKSSQGGRGHAALPISRSEFSSLVDALPDVFGLLTPTLICYVPL